MSGARLRLAASADLKQRRLLGLLAAKGRSEAELRAEVGDAQALGSLELSGFRCGWEDVKSARRGEAAPAEVSLLLRAQQAVAPEAPFGVGALRLWHAALFPSGSAFRAGERSREEAPAPAPAAFVQSRLAILEEWLGSRSGAELGAAQRGALVLARVAEILPFDDGNGRVSRLAASHVMVRAGARPPILVGGDGPRLRAALRAAFALDTQPLAELLEEASGRAIEVMIQALEPRVPGP